ncbi:MAG: SRPBCC family protein [Terriglobales bacterium]
MSKKNPDPRIIETEIEIPAPVEAVWKALTDAEELTRWFPLQARATPGVGGHLWFSWGAPWEGESRIEIWEPNRHLRTRDFVNSEASLAEESAKVGEPAAAVYVDYYLEARGGKTVLRLVHSGFGSGSDWAEELFDATRRGWSYELRSLRHYMLHHRGKPRRVAWSRVQVTATPEECWRRMFSPEGVSAESNIEKLRDGDQYRLRAVTEEVFEGVVAVSNYPTDFVGSVENMNQSFLGLRFSEPAGPDFGAGHEVSVWLATYGIPQPDVEAFEKRWKGVLGKLFPQTQAA